MNQLSQEEVEVIETLGRFFESNVDLKTELRILANNQGEETLFDMANAVQDHIDCALPWKSLALHLLDVFGISKEGLV